jgi:uncharacterized protein YbcC (UPF0753/DUF2309 family)
MFYTSTFSNRTSDRTNKGKGVAHSRETKKDVPEILRDSVRVVAPSWPLQSVVAVNPFWNLREKGFYQTLSQLSNLFGQSLFLPLESFVKKHDVGIISDDDIIRSLDSLRQSGVKYDGDLARFLRESSESTAKGLSFEVYSDLVSRLNGSELAADIITQVGKYCASYFDQGQSTFGLRVKSRRLFAEWSELIRLDKSMDYLGYRRTPDFLASLPHEPLPAIERCAKMLGIEAGLPLEIYLMKVCHRTMGWCSHVHYHLWQESLGLGHSSRGTKIEDIVAIFMAYEVWAKLANDGHDLAWSTGLKQQVVTFSQPNSDLDHNYLLLSVWQRAFEWSYQRRVASKLVAARPMREVPGEAKHAQMVFCIDVRSEVIRRKIEEENLFISTHGFAGFFGVSLDCQNPRTESRSYRCPVLLVPKLSIVEDANSENRASVYGRRAFLKFLSGLKHGLVSSFAYVEFFGVLAGAKILQRALNVGNHPAKLFHRKFDDSTELTLDLDLQSRVATATFALTHMGIREFAPVVFVCGHGSVTTNNAFASSLDCGACGGHSGEINVRILCRILNDRQVRDEIRDAGKFQIPDSTYFVPGLHETVTDEILILNENELPADAREAVSRVKASLEKAGVAAQRERSLMTDAPAVPGKERVCNWSEVRPEWALAGNASFVVAPRSRTRGMHFAGRSFLHDYDFSHDDGMKTLELIMTAPMVVTNWINMQYYASSVALNTFGAGNKVLHNIVGRMGVVEGNGGDLRIGLPLQSVHSGAELVHEPLRLSVFIEAPQDAIETIIANHPVVQQLVDNQWLHLFIIDRASNMVTYRNPGGQYEALS